jgi:long-chain fatty acid transport protein
MTRSWSLNSLNLLLMLGVTLGVFKPNSLHALGTSIPNQDAEAIARGNAFIATADNPSAIYYNPAGITQLEGEQVEFGLHNLFYGSQFESLDGTRHAQTDPKTATVPQFYFTYSPTNVPLSFGLGVYAPFGLSLQWPTNTGFNTLAIEASLTYITVNPVVAWKILPNLSLAAGPTINYSQVKLNQGIGYTPGDEFTFYGDGWAFGGTAGLLWKPHPKWAIGVNYHSPTTINYKGTSQDVPYAAPKSTSAELNFPQWVGGGIAYLPTPHWNIEVYVDWTDWSTLKTVTFKSASGNVPDEFNWQSSFMTGLGASRYFDDGWFISAGYFFSQNSTSERNFNPIVPDTDLHVGSAGFGYKAKHWNFALAGQIIAGGWRTVNDGEPSPISGQTADGKYRWFNQSVNCSVGYRF